MRDLIAGMGFDPPGSDEALRGRIASILETLPDDLAAKAVAAHLRAAIHFGYSPVGPTILELAQSIVGDRPTVERIGQLTEAEVFAQTASWRGLPWRIVESPPLPAAVNIALDDQPIEQPTLRFWNWSEPALVLGRSQSVESEIDQSLAREWGLAVVRRQSGGGTMYVEPTGTITYSLILPARLLAGASIRRSYELCDAWAILALRGLGFDAHHVPINDIACAEGKLGGAAQARRGDTILHHTTLACSMDTYRMARLLRLGSARSPTRGVTSAPKVVAALDRQSPMPKERVVEALRNGFQERYGGRTIPPTDAEMCVAERLAHHKYSDPRWTFEIP